MDAGSRRSSSTPRPDHRLAAAALPWLALLAACAAVAGAAPTPTSDLLARYEPVLLFHPQEEWPPEAVGTYLAQARVERQGAKSLWAVVPPPLPTTTAGCLLTPCFRLNLPCPLRGGVDCYRKLTRQRDWSRPVVYATATRVPPTAAPPPGFTEPPTLLLHYWLFYAVDDWRSPHSRLWQVHEGDWESISIGLGADDEPLFAAYSEHCSGTVEPWAAVTKRGTTHPVAYVALGSHANWFSATASSTRFTECLKSAGGTGSKSSRLVTLAQDAITDRMGTAHPLGPTGLAGVAPLALVQLDPAATAWARFPGRWGEGQLVWLGSKPRSFLTVSQGFGPSTPRWSAATVSGTWHAATG